MMRSEDKWVRIFDIPDINKHKKGFTIYKIISMLYPKDCPDSITKVTVWKRYNDFKRLHNDIKAQHKILKIKTKFPNLPNTSYFRRFDEDVIQQRREGILRFLEFVAAHPELFASDVCVRFFKTSYTPSDLLNSNIHSIRAELHLPEESEYDLVQTYSEDERTISDTDSVSTLSSTFDHLPDPLNPSNSGLSTRISRKSTYSRTSSHDSLSISTTNLSLDGSSMLEVQTLATPPQTPSSTTTSNPIYYIVEASRYITQAIDCEVAKKYEEAFSAYKMGIDILLKNVKDDKDFDRKEMVRHKTEKYLLRAEKLYNLHLSPESKTIQSYITENDSTKKEEEQPIMSDLHKYKVLKIISSGMLVLHTDSQQLFYIKVIHKTSRFSHDKLILPGNVPYMVKLYNYYNCENALFLILQYCSFIKLEDYIKQKFTNCNLLNYNLRSSILLDNSTFKDEDISDSDSEHSYSDLINDYQISRLNKTDSVNDAPVDVPSSDDSSELKLANGTDCSLGENKLENKSETYFNSNQSTRSSRKSSERSELSLFEDFHLTETILPLNDVTKWAAQLLLTLERLHAVGVICCDLQMKNLLIDDSGNLILTYMCSVSEKYDVAFSQRDNLIWAPEMYSFQQITEAVDWWSYGVILYEMLVGMSLEVLHPEGFFSHTLLKIPKYVTVEARSLLKQLLTYESHERLGHGINGAEDIKSHPFFNSISWKDVECKYAH